MDNANRSLKMKDNQIRVVTLEYEGAEYTVEDGQNVLDTLRGEMDVAKEEGEDREYRIRIHSMCRDCFDRLPEFDGF